MPTPEEINNLISELTTLTQAINNNSTVLATTVVQRVDDDKELETMSAEMLAEILNERFATNNTLVYRNEDQRKVALIQAQNDNPAYVTTRAARTALIETEATQKAAIERDRNLFKVKLALLQYYVAATESAVVVTPPPTQPPTTPTTPQLWLPTAALSATPGYYGIATQGNKVHTVSSGYDAASPILYRRSDDEGANWNAPVNLGAGIVYLEKPLAANANVIALVYTRDVVQITDFYGTRTVGNLAVRSSVDNGATWRAEQIISNGGRNLRQSIAVSTVGGVTSIHIVWMDYRNGRWDLFYARSINGGVSFLPEVLLVPGAADGTLNVGAARPTIAAIGNKISIYWMDSRDNNNSGTIEGGTFIPQYTEIYRKNSSDNGASWGADARLTGIGGSAANPYSGRPSAESGVGTDLHLLFDRRNRTAPIKNKLAYMKSANGGDAFAAEVFLTDASGDATHGSTAVKDNNLFVVYSDDKSGTDLVYSRKSTNGGTAWEAEQVVSSEFGGAAPLTAMSTNYVHTLYGGAADIRYSRHSITGSIAAVSYPIARSVRFYPKAGAEQRSANGIIQGSNTSQTSGFVDLGTLPAAPVAGWQEVAFANATEYKYLRIFYPAAAGEYRGDISELEFRTVSGAAIGRAAAFGDGWYGQPDPSEDFNKAFDGDLVTRTIGALNTIFFVGIEVLPT
ncbi:MAG: glycoside hydrolase [Acidobacteriota bacterium]|nr:glycoside hydrolase [Acidobacteriota bacterium]